jgi:hypothetical protein
MKGWILRLSGKFNTVLARSCVRVVLTVAVASFLAVG